MNSDKPIKFPPNYFRNTPDPVERFVMVTPLVSSGQGRPNDATDAAAEWVASVVWGVVFLFVGGVAGLIVGFLIGRVW